MSVSKPNICTNTREWNPYLQELLTWISPNERHIFIKLNNYKLSKFLLWIYQINMNLYRFYIYQNLILICTCSVTVIKWQMNRRTNFKFHASLLCLLSYTWPRKSLNTSLNSLLCVKEQSRMWALDSDDKHRREGKLWIPNEGGGKI